MAKQRRVILLETGDRDVVVKGGKRLKVEQWGKMEAVEVSSGEEEERMPWCVYPKGRGAISLYAEDLARLEEGRFLNDQIVNLTLKWLFENVLTPQNKQQAYVCDTHFFSELTSGMDRTKVATGKEKLLDNAKRLLRHSVTQEGIARNLVVIPICEDQHWYLATIINKNDTATILIMDSFANHSRMHVVEILGQLWTAMNLAQKCIAVNIRVVQQDNLYDCGVHLLHNAEVMLRYMNDQPRAEVEPLEALLNMGVASRAELKKMLQQINSPSPKPQQQITTPQQIQQQQQITTPQQIQQQQLIPPSHQNATHKMPQQQQTATQQLIPPSHQNETHKMPQQQPIATPHPVSQSQHMTTQTIIQPGCHGNLNEGISLINKTTHEWIVTEELEQALMEAVYEARKKGQEANKRRIKFKKEWDHGTFQFEVPRSGGQCRVFKI